MGVTRRGLVGASTLTFAAAAAAPGAQAQAPARPQGRGESVALARHVATARFEDLPADVVALTKQAILDGIGTSIAASGMEPACRAFIDAAVEDGGKPEATIIGTGQRSDVRSAARAIGSFAHALDYEDAHEETRTHPNAAAIAAALPLAEKVDASGADVILAVALGSDMVCRLARASDYGRAPPPGFYPPVVSGTFGAATAAAKVLTLDAQQVLDTWSLALCQNSASAELQNTPDSQMRAVRDGLSADTGVGAALLARRGVRGFDKPFEGESGYFVMYIDGKQRPGVLDADIGRRFSGSEVAFKAWPSCRDTHIYIQAVLDLRQAAAIDPAQIAEIEVVVAPPNMIVCEPADLKRRPATATAGKFSIYFCVAAALLKGQVDLSSFSDAALKDPEVLACAAKVRYRVDPAVAKATGEGGGDILLVRMKDGTVHRRSVKAVLGSRAAPLSEAALVSKFVDCGVHAARPRSRGELERIAEQILTLDRLPKARTLIRRL